MVYKRRRRQSKYRRVRRRIGSRSKLSRRSGMRMRRRNRVRSAIPKRRPAGAPFVPRIAGVGSTKTTTLKGQYDLKINMGDSAIYNVFREAAISPQRAYDPFNTGTVGNAMDGLFLYNNNFEYMECLAYSLKVTATNYSTDKVMKVWWVVVDKDDAFTYIGLTLKPADYLKAGNVKCISIPPQQHRIIRLSVNPRQWFKRDSNPDNSGKYLVPNNKSSPLNPSSWGVPGSETYVQMFVSMPSWSTGQAASATFEMELYGKYRFYDRRDIFVIDRDVEIQENDENPTEAVGFSNAHIEVIDPVFKAEEIG